MFNFLSKSKVKSVHYEVHTTDDTVSAFVSLQYKSKNAALFIMNDIKAQDRLYFKGRDGDNFNPDILPKYKIVKISVIEKVVG